MQIGKLADCSDTSSYFFLSDKIQESSQEIYTLIRIYLYYTYTSKY